ncbi:MAG: hypoxanthine phosphoribosyltransferase [Planctomycetota bacterium]
MIVAGGDAGNAPRKIAEGLFGENLGPSPLRHKESVMHPSFGDDLACYDRRTPGDWGQLLRNSMHDDIKEVLFGEELIRSRLATLGAEIARDYQGDQLVLMALLKGGVVFISDLMRHIPIHLDIDFIQASSYGLATTSSGTVDIKVFPQLDYRGKRLLILDDILDTGRTLHRVCAQLKARGAEDVRTCVLLNKKARRIVEMKADYIGFEVEDQFVVGYGLDYADKYRNLPFIGVLKEACYAADNIGDAAVSEKDASGAH